MTRHLGEGPAALERARIPAHIAEIDAAGRRGKLSDEDARRLSRLFWSGSAPDHATEADR
jgi:hypothetical protein